ncbi:ASCH domain-containing protein [Pontivivens ytuae]|uniref:ASCH domain-containing protein n=2 Tax=Pontivivens ytuae TaxID=2789856 RepID=A0A7S9LVV0_9RHOB|nr:ASCH domain-containing protein [Pontivivens ytuae]QPH56214.1 ASCH domain-containing protein [Pontivivens ytuae]
MGDSRMLCDRLIALVRAGKKRATCGPLADYEAGKDDVPVVGRRDIALDWDGNPVFVIETLHTEQIRFCDVPEELALAEGEDETLEGWRAGHAEYFKRNGGFDPEMMLVFERFRLVEDLA